MKKILCFSIFLFLSITSLTICLASKSANPFEGFWSNDFGTVGITNCLEDTCKIEISTNNDIYICELNGKLNTLKNKNTAIFQLENLETSTDEKKKYVSINVSLAEQTLTITTPEESYSIARGFCGAKAFFDGKYTK